MGARCGCPMKAPDVKAPDVKAPGMRAPGTKARVTAYAVGAGFIQLGRWVLRVQASIDPEGWALWFAGAAIVHDGSLVPGVLMIGALTARLPSRYKRWVQGTLLVAGVVTLVALPMVLGYGRRADNPSILPLSYGRN